MNNEFLRMYRARKNYSQQKVSDMARINRNTYWAFENGVKVSQITNLIKIFKVLELTDDEILNIMRYEKGEQD